MADGKYKKNDVEDFLHNPLEKEDGMLVWM
jgi:hypothetical protein